MSGCGVALRRRLLRRLRLGLVRLLVALGLAPRIGLRLALGVALRSRLGVALLFRARGSVGRALIGWAAVRLVPARALEDDRRHRQEAPRLLAAARALVQRLVVERLDRREHVTALITAVVV